MKRQITLTLLPIGLLVFCLTFGHLTIAAPGDLDPTFSGDGKLTEILPPVAVATGNRDEAGLMAIQPDGKIVIAGKSYTDPRGPANRAYFMIARFNPHGSLDPTFGQFGMVLTDVTSDTYSSMLSAIAIQPDGKIVTAGFQAGATANVLLLVRDKPDGKLDNTFGQGGKLLGPINGNPHSVVIQPDGKIVAAGSVFNGLNSDFAVVRFNSDGSLDTSFDGDGVVTTDIAASNNFASSVALQSDQKLVVADHTDFDWETKQSALVRYNPDGSIDTSFDGDGVVTNPITVPAWRLIEEVKIQPDGKLLATSGDAFIRYNSEGSLDSTFSNDGTMTIPKTSSYIIQTNGKILTTGYDPEFKSFIVTRYNSNGSLDSSLDNDGTVMTFTGLFANAFDVAAQPDGKIVAVGLEAETGIPGISGATDIAAVRYNPDGSLDSTFDGDGIVFCDSVVPSFLEATFRAVAMQSDGKIVAVGSGLARYNPDGSPDTSFGNAGKVDQGGSSVAIQSDGKIVVTGGNTLARYNPNGTPDIAFGNGSGSVVVDISPSGASIAAAIQPDGKILVAGYFGFPYCDDSEDPNCPYYTHDFLLARYNANGSVDTSFGSEGKVVTDVAVNFVDHDYANSVVIQADGKIIVAGDADADFALVRYNSN